MKAKHFGRAAALVAAGLAGFAMSAPARADDAPAGWSGLYLGANLNGGWTTQTLTTAPHGTLVTAPFDGSLGWGQSQSITSNADIGAGIEGGFDWQVGSGIVLGLAVDVQSYGATVTNNNAFTSNASGSGNVGNNLSSRTPWLGTIRGRLGFTPQPNLLIYATGGLALGQENVTGSITTTTAGAPLENFAYSMSKTLTGYAIGGGGEWRIAGGWSLKGEYLHLALPSGPQLTVPTAILGPSALPTDTMSLAAGSENINIIRVGVVYHFGVPTIP